MRIGVASVLAMAAASAATASPGPPPPGYIMDLARSLAAPTTAERLDLLSRSCGSDLQVSINGRPVAVSGRRWLEDQRRRLGKVDRQVLAYSPGYDSIMIFERVDDRSALPQTPGMLFDARYVTRAIQYQFGDDHLIHAIRILEGGVYVATPDR